MKFLIVLMLFFSSVIAFAEEEGKSNKGYKQVTYQEELLTSIDKYFKILDTPVEDQKLVEAIYLAHKAVSLQMQFVAETDIGLATWIHAMRYFYENPSELPKTVSPPPTKITLFEFILWYVDKILSERWNKRLSDNNDLWVPLVPGFLAALKKNP